MPGPVLRAVINGKVQTVDDHRASSMRWLLPLRGRVLRIQTSAICQIDAESKPERQAERFLEGGRRQSSDERVCGNGYPLSFLLSVAALRPTLLQGSPGMATETTWRPQDRLPPRSQTTKPRGVHFPGPSSPIHWRSTTLVARDQMCQLLGVSRSGVHAARVRPASARAQTDTQLTGEIRRQQRCHRGRYGRLPRPRRRTRSGSRI